MRVTTFLVMLCCVNLQFGQLNTSIFGTVKERITKSAITNVVIRIDGVSKQFQTDSNGRFSIPLRLTGNCTIRFSAPDVISKQFEVFLEGNPVDLGEILLEKDIAVEKTDNLITLTDTDISDDDGLSVASMGLLQSTRDIFLNRAAFDFGQAFFKVKGYDSQNGQVLINGIPMNKFWDGRPQWNNWGGLNDVVRNQEFTSTLAVNPYTFGGILGNTNINTRPSGFRPGLRVSSSASNRTYAGRIMATYSAALSGNKTFYSISSSRRWANSGYVKGTLYDAYSFFGSLEFKLTPKNSIVLTTILARNRRGRSAAMTEEIFNLMGNKYNPYWGSQNGKVRNSRERMIFEPLVVLNHYLQSKKLNWTNGVAYQTGTTAKSRLGYFNAPNPDPTYYKYVPSYHINSAIGADFTNAHLAGEGLARHSQIPWGRLYEANSNNIENPAAYVLYQDVAIERQLTLVTNLDFQLTKMLKLGLGANYRNANSSNFGQIEDLLGADFHEDVDTFSNTQNDLKGSETKSVGDKIGYHFELTTHQFNGFGQLEIKDEKWDGFVAASFLDQKVNRNGLFQNERFLENSEGRSAPLTFVAFGFKSGFTYFLNGRHSLSIGGAQIHRPPTLQNLFINPRENNNSVPEIKQEKISVADLNYNIRLPDLTGRISAFYTRFQNITDVNFFFTNSGLGSDFVQEVITDLDKLHKGLELGLEYQVSTEVKLSMVGNLGNYTYANDPLVQLYFDTSGPEEDLINAEGTKDLGIAKLKGLNLAQGPQFAVSLGTEYRSPHYWWMGVTANFLDRNYTNISTIQHTQSFLLDPDTGERFIDATDENITQILNQEKLEEIYLLNLIGGKSWLVDKKYISAFLSVSNLFDSVFKTGGYQQSRNGNYKQMYQDNLSGTPSFGPKYWYSYGRTYFLNLAVSF